MDAGFDVTQNIKVRYTAPTPANHEKSIRKHKTDNCQ